MELNQSNTILYINEQNYKFKKFFRPKKEGIYTVKLEIKKETESW